MIKLLFGFISYSILPPLPIPTGSTMPWGTPATYWTNPQFKLHLDEADEDQEERAAESCCAVLLGLM